MQAQSSVTLYGRLEASYGVSRTTNGFVDIGSGVGDVSEQRSTGLMDGSANGLGGSRWGLRGSEDLGGGLSANFQIEQRFNINNGNTVNTRQFHGKSVVGLSGAFGTVNLGRDYTPAFGVSAATDVDGMSSFSTTSALSSVRRESSITYTSPDFSGFSAKLQLAPTKSVTDVELGTGIKVSGTGVSVAYSSGPLYVGLGYENDKTTALLGGAFVKNTGWNLGATYDFGSVKLLGNYFLNKTTATALDDDSLKVTEYNLGLSVPFGAASFVAGVGKTKAKVASISDSGDTEWLIGANYSLSKRTSVFVRAGKSIGMSAVGATLTGAESKRTAVGLTHTF